MRDKKPIAITGTWLRTIGGNVQLLVEVDGRWRLVNNEPLLDGADTVINHITEPCGIEKCQLDPVTEAKS